MSFNFPPISDRHNLNRFIKILFCGQLLYLFRYNKKIKNINLIIPRLHKMKRFILLIILLTTLSYTTTTHHITNPYKKIRYTQKYNSGIRAILIEKEKNFNRCYRKFKAFDICILREEEKKDNISMIYRLKKAGYKRWLKLMSEK